MGVEHQLNDVMICPRAHRLKAVIYISEWASATSAPRSAIPPGPRLLAQKLHYCTLQIGTKKGLEIMKLLAVCAGRGTGWNRIIGWWFRYYIIYTGCPMTTPFLHHPLKLLNERPLAHAAWVIALKEGGI